MDLMTAPSTERPATDDREPALRHGLDDPWLRTQLPAAVQARPDDDGVDPRVWRQVADCLDATALAARCATEGGRPTRTAVLVSAALQQTSRTAAEVVRGQVREGGRPPQGRAVVPLQQRSRSAGQVPVERTWFRLAGLLLGPAPADGVLLAQVLDEHCAALAQWRRVLLGPVRVRRAQVRRVRRA